MLVRRTAGDVQALRNAEDAEGSLEIPVAEQADGVQRGPGAVDPVQTVGDGRVRRRTFGYVIGPEDVVTGAAPPRRRVQGEEVALSVSRRPRRARRVQQKDVGARPDQRIARVER